MRQVWPGVLGVLSGAAIVCVAVVGAQVLQVGVRARSLLGTNASRRAPSPGSLFSEDVRFRSHEGVPQGPFVEAGEKRPVGLHPARGPGTAEPAVDTANTVGPPPGARGAGDEGAVDLITLDWMARDEVRVRFPGGRTHALPLFTRVPAGMYMLEFYGPKYPSVLCQVQVNPRRRSHVTFGGQDCRVVLND